MAAFSSFELGIRNNIMIRIQESEILKYGSGSRRPNNYRSDRIRILPGHFCGHWKKKRCPMYYTAKYCQILNFTEIPSTLWKIPIHRIWIHNTIIGMPLAFLKRLLCINRTYDFSQISIFLFWVPSLNTGTWRLPDEKKEVGGHFYNKDKYFT
jgi:hypothetical protein